jgi:asparagine synthase (glutamine-hydrolysing)
MSHYSQIGGKYFKFQNVLLADSFDDFFEKSSSYLLDEQLTKLTRQSTYKDNTRISGSQGRLITYLGVKDMVSYLPGDILTKVDRASMSVGLEAREPFLDQNIVDFALRIEDKFKFDKNEKGKFLLKKILKKYIPATIVDRPKQGFSVPIEKWMKSILYNDLVELVDDSSFFERFQLDQEVCKEYFRSFHNDENRINPNEIWFIYCLHQWYKRWL